MASFLKRLFGKPSFSLAPDVSQGDWAPVPVSATAQIPNVMGWLQEQPSRPRMHGEPVRLRRRTIRRMYKHLTGLVGASDQGLDDDTIDEHTPPHLHQHVTSAEERDDPTLPDNRSQLAARTDLTRRDDPALSHRRPASACLQHPSPALDHPSSSSKYPRSVVEKDESRVGEAASSREAPAAPDNKWIDVLRNYGEHLTEEELKAIKEQLA